MTYRVLGLSGKAGTGKDYISGQWLTSIGFRQWSLAWHFKVWLAAKGDATMDEVFVTKPPHVRHLLQQEGTERGRQVYGADIWTRTATIWMTLLHEQWGVERFLIADLRFPNEVEWVQSLGGKVMRLEAPIRARQSPLSAEARNHISETALDGYVGFDATLLNDPVDVGTEIRQLLGIMMHWGWKDVAHNLVDDDTEGAYS